MGCGVDSWRPYGQVFGHPNIENGKTAYTSTPVELDEEKLTFKTASGRLYKIMSFDGQKDKWLEQIKEDIKLGGTEQF